MPHSHSDSGLDPTPPDRPGSIPPLSSSLSSSLSSTLSNSSYPYSDDAQGNIATTSSSSFFFEEQTRAIVNEFHALVHFSLIDEINNMFTFSHCPIQTPNTTINKTKTNGNGNGNDNDHSHINNKIQSQKHIERVMLNIQRHIQLYFGISAMDAASHLQDVNNRDSDGNNKNKNKNLFVSSSTDLKEVEDLTCHIIELLNPLKKSLNRHKHVPLFTSRITFILELLTQNCKEYKRIWNERITTRQNIQELYNREIIRLCAFIHSSIVSDLSPTIYTIIESWKKEESQIHNDFIIRYSDLGKMRSKFYTSIYAWCLHQSKACSDMLSLLEQKIQKTSEDIILIRTEQRKSDNLNNNSNNDNNAKKSNIPMMQYPRGTSSSLSSSFNCYNDKINEDNININTNNNNNDDENISATRRLGRQMVAPPTPFFPLSFKNVSWLDDSNLPSLSFLNQMTNLTMKQKHNALQHAMEVWTKFCQNMEDYKFSSCVIPEIFRLLQEWLRYYETVFVELCSLEEKTIRHNNTINNNNNNNNNMDNDDDDDINRTKNIDYTSFKNNKNSNSAYLSFVEESHVLGQEIKESENLLVILQDQYDVQMEEIKKTRMARHDLEKHIQGHHFTSSNKKAVSELHKLQNTIQTLVHASEQNKRKLKELTPLIKGIKNNKQTLNRVVTFLADLRDGLFEQWKDACIEESHILQEWNYCRLQYHQSYLYLRREQIALIDSITDEACTKISLFASHLFTKLSIRHNNMLKQSNDRVQDILQYIVQAEDLILQRHSEITMDLPYESKLILTFQADVNQLSREKDVYDIERYKACMRQTLHRNFDYLCRGINETFQNEVVDKTISRMQICCTKENMRGSSHPFKEALSHQPIVSILESEVHKTLLSVNSPWVHATDSISKQRQSEMNELNNLVKTFDDARLSSHIGHRMNVWTQPSSTYINGYAEAILNEQNIISYEDHHKYYKCASSNSNADNCDGYNNDDKDNEKCIDSNNNNNNNFLSRQVDMELELADLDREATKLFERMDITSATSTNIESVFNDNDNENNNQNQNLIDILDKLIDNP